MTPSSKSIAWNSFLSILPFSEIEKKKQLIFLKIDFDCCP